MPIEKDEATGAITITGPHIDLYRLIVLRSALKLQIQGVRVNRRISATRAVQEVLGTKVRDKAALLAMITDKINNWTPEDSE